MNKLEVVNLIEENMATKHGARLSYQAHVRDNWTRLNLMLDKSIEIRRLTEEANTVIRQYTSEQRLCFALLGEAPADLTEAQEKLSRADAIERSFYTA